MSRYNSILEELNRNIDDIKAQKIWELGQKPGTSKCETLANNLQQGITALIEGYEDLIVQQQQAADKEQFEILFTMIKNLSAENKEFMKQKKTMNEILNSYKIKTINKVLLDLKEILKDEPSAKFLDIISEEINENKKADGQNNSVSDVALVLSQYQSACENYSKKYYHSKRTY